MTLLQQQIKLHEMWKVVQVSEMGTHGNVTPPKMGMRAGETQYIKNTKINM
jgi:hypothetical protein